MRREKFKFVEKVWGEELWLVNDTYCSKLLIVEKNAVSSLHYHSEKQETFYCIEGHGNLTIEGKIYTLAPFVRPKTIFPGEKHSFKAITPMVILELSTHHKDKDVVRLEASKPGDESLIA